MAKEQSTLELVVELVDNASEKMEGIKNKTQEANESVSEGMDDSSDAADNMAESMQENADAADEAENSFMRLTGRGLALLFAGRFLKQTFGGLVGSMASIVGISQQLSATMKSVLSPAFTQLQTMLQPAFNYLMNLGKNQKLIVGWAVILGTALGAVLSVVGLVIAGISAFSTAAASTAATVGVLVAVFAAIAVVGFQIGRMIGNTLMSAWNKLTTGIKDLAGYVMNDLPGDIKQGFREMVNKAKNKWGQITTFFTDTLPTKVKNGVSSLVDTIKTKAGNLMDAFLNKVKEYKDDFKKFFKGLIPSLEDVKDWAGGAADAAGSAADSAISGAKDALSFGANDFVLSGNKLIKTHPNDVIFGTKQPEKLGMGGGQGNVTINVDRPQLKNDMDVDRMVDKIERRIDRDTRGRSGIA